MAKASATDVGWDYFRRLVDDEDRRTAAGNMNSPVTKEPEAEQYMESLRPQEVTGTPFVVEYLTGKAAKQWIADITRRNGDETSKLWALEDLYDAVRNPHDPTPGVALMATMTGLSVSEFCEYMERTCARKLGYSSPQEMYRREMRPLQLKAALQEATRTAAALAAARQTA